MAPSVTDSVSHVADQIQEKISSVSLKDTKVESEAKAEDGPAPAVQKPAAQVEAQHKEPLKLSGALDHFESFDVTPVIGREFVGVNLAKWLRAPNSDELLRDLAITSKSSHMVLSYPSSSPHSQSPSAAWCSSVSKTISRMISKRSSCNDWESFPANQLPQSCTFIPSQTQAENSAARMMKSASSPLSKQRRSTVTSFSSKPRRSRVARRDGTLILPLNPYQATTLCCA